MCVHFADHIKKGIAWSWRFDGRLWVSRRSMQTKSKKAQETTSSSSRMHNKRTSCVSDFRTMEMRKLMHQEYITLLVCNIQPANDGNGYKLAFCLTSVRNETAIPVREANRKGSKKPIEKGNKERDVFLKKDHCHVRMKFEKQGRKSRLWSKKTNVSVISYEMLKLRSRQWTIRAIVLHDLFETRKKFCSIVKFWWLRTNGQWGQCRCETINWVVLAKRQLSVPNCYLLRIQCLVGKKTVMSRPKSFSRGDSWWQYTGGWRSLKMNGLVVHFCLMAGFRGRSLVCLGNSTDRASNLPMATTLWGSVTMTLGVVDGVRHV